MPAEIVTQIMPARAAELVLESSFYIPMTGPAARPRRSLKHDDTFIVLDSHGDIGASAGGPDGLFNTDTRYLARLELVLDDVQPLLLGSNLRDDNSGLTIDLTNPDVYRDGRIVLQRDMLHIVRTIFLWRGTAYQRIGIQNHSETTASFDVTLLFDNDFADHGVATADFGGDDDAVPPPAFEDGRDLGFERIEGADDRKADLSILNSLLAESGLPTETRQRIERRVRRMHEAGLLDSPDVTEGNLRMARIPSDPAHVFKNRRGMAPGVLYEASGKRLFVLPGVPLELKGIFTEEIEPEFLAEGSAATVREVRFTFAVEARFYPLMRELEASFPDVSVGSYPNFETKELVIRCLGTDPKRVDEVVEIVRRRTAQLGMNGESKR